MAYRNFTALQRKLAAARQRTMLRLQKDCNRDYLKLGNSPSLLRTGNILCGLLLRADLREMDGRAADTERRLLRIQMHKQASRFEIVAIARAQAQCIVRRGRAG